MFKSSPLRRLPLLAGTLLFRPLLQFPELQASCAHRAWQCRRRRRLYNGEFISQFLLWQLWRRWESNCECKRWKVHTFWKSIWHVWYFSLKRLSTSFETALWVSLCAQFRCRKKNTNDKSGWKRLLCVTNDLLHYTCTEKQKSLRFYSANKISNGLLQIYRWHEIYNTPETYDLFPGMSGSVQQVCLPIDQPVSLQNKSSGMQARTLQKRIFRKHLNCSGFFCWEAHTTSRRMFNSIATRNAISMNCHLNTRDQNRHKCRHSKTKKSTNAEAQCLSCQIQYFAEWHEKKDQREEWNKRNSKQVQFKAHLIFLFSHCRCIWA